MLFGRSRNLIGLDIGDSSIKVVELKDAGRGGYQVQRLGWEALAAEAIVDGQIMDSQLVAETIRRLFQRSKLKTTTPVATALSGHHVIVKRISLPRMSEAELAESIHWEAEQYIPFDIDDVNLDYEVLDGSSLSGEGANMDVLLAAAKKDKINDYVGVVREAGLNAATVDIAAFAMQNAFEANYEFSADQVIALVDIGAAVSSISVLHRGSSVYWRDINIGGHQYTDAIQKELSVSAEQAEQLKRGEEIDGIPYERVLPILASVSDDIGTEIQKTLDFFKQISATDRQLDRLYLTGGAAQVTHMKESLAERLHTQVELLNPFRRIAPASKSVSAELVEEMMPTASVAVGLALRRLGD